VRGRESDGAGIHRLSDDPLHRGDLVGTGRPLRRLFAHHVLAHGRMSDERRDVDPERQSRDGIEVLGEALEAPGNPGLQRLEAHAFDVLENARDLGAIRGPGRCDSEAAITHDDRRDAVPGRGRQVRVPEDLRIVVRVDVDEAGAHDQTRAVDLEGPARVAR